MGTSIFASASPIISLKRFSFSHGSHTVFKSTDIDIPKGKITGIMGPSGCGKSTLLQLIGGLITPDAGQVYVQGSNINQLNRNQLMKLRQNMGVLFQSGALFTQMNVYNNVAFPIRENTDLPAYIIREIVKMKLEAVGLRGIIDQWPSELSGGMARRVALARAIALDPAIMMYDEPFTGQDPVSLGVILKLIQSLNQSLNITSIVISHDIQEIMSIADYILILGEKTLLAQGKPDEIKNNSSGFVRQFLSGKPDGSIAFHHPAPPFMEH